MQYPPEHAACRHGGGKQQEHVKHGDAYGTSADTDRESKWSWRSPPFVRRPGGHKQRLVVLHDRRRVGRIVGHRHRHHIRTAKLGRPACGRILVIPGDAGDGSETMPGVEVRQNMMNAVAVETSRALPDRLGDRRVAAMLARVERIRR